jgi:hypothetical protein
MGNEYQWGFVPAMLRDPRGNGEMSTYIQTVRRRSANRKGFCVKTLGFAVLVTALLFTGCAGVSVQRDVVGRGPKSGADSFLHGLFFFAQPKGIRYYQPANFILVTVDPTGTVITEHKILPDLERKLSAQPVAFLSKIGPIGNSGGEIVLKDGMMVSTKFNADATVIPTAVIKTAEQLASAVVKAAGPALAGAVFDRPMETKEARVFLFRLRLNNEEGHYELVGQEGFKIAVVAPKDGGGTR